MLFRVYGFETATHPVNDRPRMSGDSKYTNFGRLMIAIYDLIGVIWLRRRTRIPRIAVDTGTVERRWSLDYGAQAAPTPPQVASPARHTPQREATMNGRAN
jgi:dolichol-phosphate mannosyltransferase